MSSNKARGKDKKKSSQLVIRVEKAERDAFVALCDQLDTSAAREIRQFMRERVATQGAEGATSIEPEVPSVAEVADGKPVSAEGGPVATDAAFDGTNAGEVEKPKKKQKRAAQ